MALLYSAYVQYQRKLISTEVWEAYERSAIDQFRAPGYLAAWLTLKDSYPVGFCEVVDRLEIEVGSAT